MKTIAVIFGGRSVEHDVSIITAHTPIITSLIASGNFSVVPIYIARDGSWYSTNTMNDIAFFKNPEFDAVLAKLSKARLLFDAGLKLVWSGLLTKRIDIDVVFPAMHGTYGEDGSLMGLLRMAGVPFVGCDLVASAIAMDKVATKQVVAAEGMPIVPYVWFTKSGWISDNAIISARIENLGFPLFVKPAHLGSSIGITKVGNTDELKRAIEIAFHYDDKVLVEKSVENLIEVTLPIMGNDVLELGVIERPLNKTELFSFEDKYLRGGKKGGGANSAYSELPASIDPALANQVTDLGRRVYRALGCTGISRIDFLIDATSNTVYVNEVNTLPGSLYHHNWRSVGISNVMLVTKLVAMAEDRFATREKATHTFRSTILNEVGGAKFERPHA